MLEEQIKQANIQAMKDKDSVARAFYSVLMNKILLEKISRRESGKDFGDNDVATILQKMIKELGDELENYKKVNNSEQVASIERQIKIAESYLPKQLSAEEIKKIILSLPDKSVPTVMKHFKTNFSGKVDMRLVSEVLKGI